jgi:formylglycine-generating enzyme required for sulfatase activity
MRLALVSWPFANPAGLPRGRPRRRGRRRPRPRRAWPAVPGADLLAAASLLAAVGVTAAAAPAPGAPATATAAGLPAVAAPASRAASPGTAFPPGFVLIPAGAFLMGSPPDEPFARADETRREVTISRPFLLAAREVSRAEWRQATGESAGYFAACELCPVESISWFDAVRFCNLLSARDGLRPAYRIDGERVTWDTEADGYRLPTEAEWEYACRAGTRTPFSTGTCIASDQANFDGYHPPPGCPEGLFRGEPIPVGSLAANAWGLHDMHGNVEEWCWDWHAAYPVAGGQDPRGPAAGEKRVARGGSWARFAVKCRAAHREKRDPRQSLDTVGLRLARSVAR